MRTFWNEEVTQLKEEYSNLGATPKRLQAIIVPILSYFRLTDVSGVTVKFTALERVASPPRYQTYNKSQEILISNGIVTLKVRLSLVRATRSVRRKQLNSTS